MTTQSKVYLNIVQKIRSIMEADGLGAGDRLPSERELSARLGVGRSSVREALRALELVGLIETRRGEGTFVKHFYDHSLVQLIAGFVLQDEKAKQDLVLVKALLEQDIIRLLCQNEKTWDILSCRDVESDFADAFFKEAAERTDNFLLYRLWLILRDYTATLPKCQHENKAKYLQLFYEIQHKNEVEALDLYKNIHLSKEM